MNFIQKYFYFYLYFKFRMGYLRIIGRIQHFRREDTMKNRNVLILTAAGAATLFSACLFQSPDSQANATAKFQFQATAAASTLAKSAAAGGLQLSDASGSTFTVTEAHLYVKSIKLESEEGSDDIQTGCDSSGNKVMLAKEGDSTEIEAPECDEGQDLNLKGPFIVDLINGTSSPEIAPMTVPAGSYSEIKLRLDHGNLGDTSALNGSTLIAKGTLTRPDGTSRPFSLDLRLHEDLKIKSKAGITLDGSGIHTILVAINAGDWLAKLDVSGCLASDTTAAGREIVVSESSAMGKCLDAEHILKDSFKKSCQADEKDEPETDGGKGAPEADSGKGK